MPEYPGPVEIKDNHPGMISRTYEIEVITPLFGGGVEAGKVDPEHPIRESSIRGHLRFWWRVTRGAEYDSITLRQREEEIWGSSTSPSSVIIEVETSKRELKHSIGSAQYFEVKRGGPDGYVLFSADKATSLLYDQQNNFSFKLLIRWYTQTKLQKIRNIENADLKCLGKPTKPDIIQDISTDVETAIQAWVNFGGIGARTRRGCGALYCEKLALSGGTDFKKFPFRFFLNNTLSSADPINVWMEAVEPLRKFRQDLRGPLHPKKILNKYGIMKKIQARGRSYWPEPDSIRKITKCALRKPNLNMHDHSEPQTPIKYFPRSQFGLPIVFHFGDGPEDDTYNPDLDPPTVTLIPINPDGSDGTRMASPVITRPLCFKGGSIVPMILILKSITPSKVRLTDNNKKRFEEISANHIQNPVLAEYSQSPMGRPKPESNYYRSSVGSALEAFIAYVLEKEQGFIEVSK